MFVRILAFGAARDIVGQSVSVQKIREHTTVAEILDELRQQYPKLTQLRSLAIAVNGTYAAAETIVNETDEVALIPPVSGG